MAEAVVAPGALVTVRFGPHDGMTARVEWCRDWTEPYAPGGYVLCGYRSDDGRIGGTVRARELSPVPEGTIDGGEAPREGTER